MLSPPPPCIREGEEEEELRRGTRFPELGLRFPQRARGLGELGGAAAAAAVGGGVGVRRGAEASRARERRHEAEASAAAADVGGGRRRRRCAHVLEFAERGVRSLRRGVCGVRQDLLSG